MKFSEVQDFSANNFSRSFDFWLVVSNTCYMFTLIWGSDSQFDEHIFQRGFLFNHQLDVSLSKAETGRRKPQQPTEVMESDSSWLQVTIAPPDFLTKFRNPKRKGMVFQSSCLLQLLYVELQLIYIYIVVSYSYYLYIHIYIFTFLYIYCIYILMCVIKCVHLGIHVHIEHSQFVRYINIPWTPKP